MRYDDRSVRTRVNGTSTVAGAVPARSEAAPCCLPVAHCGRARASPWRSKRLRGSLSPGMRWRWGRRRSRRCQSTRQSWTARCGGSSARLRHAANPKRFGFAVQVDMRKINLEVLKPWIATRITELLGGLEDEVLIGAGCTRTSRQPCKQACCTSRADAATRARPSRQQRALPCA